MTSSLENLSTREVAQTFTEALAARGLEMPALKAVEVKVAVCISTHVQDQRNDENKGQCR